ncbi:hypothetical protein PGQ11_000978 [Apiospora arundinis]
MSQLPHHPTELLMLIVEQLGGIREIVGKHELRYFHRAPGFLLVFEEVERVKDLRPQAGNTSEEV